MADFDSFIKSIHNEFGAQKKGKPFEKFCKWFLQNDPVWSKTVAKVWTWEEYPEKWQTDDLGTDLVFEDKAGLTWAVQSKCYSEQYSTTKTDMDSFLADSGRKQVHRRLWMQSTNRINAKALKIIKNQDKPVTIYNLDDFRNAQVKYPSKFSELLTVERKKKPIPDLHQDKAIKDVISGLEDKKRGQLIMACGTGKTFTTLWIKEGLKAKTTLVLLPSLNLLSQTLKEWASAANFDFEILNVCSDKTVGNNQEDLDPSTAPFKVTADVNDIKEFLCKTNDKVIFCTYHSSILIAEAQSDKKLPDFDLIICDEAHNCAGKVSSQFSIVLDEKRIRADKRLFTTATPRYFAESSKKVAVERNQIVIGMDDQNIFGPKLHKLSFGEAINYKPEPLLNDYQVIVIGVDEPKIKHWIEDRNLVQTKFDKITDAELLGSKIGVIKAIKDYNLTRLISFHSRVDRAKEFSAEFMGLLELIKDSERPPGKILIDYVSGKMSSGERQEKVRKLKILDGYDIGILTNARCLSEGVNVPALDGVAFIDPKSSQIDIIQAVGRAIRKVRGEATQKKGTIIIPIFLDSSDDFNTEVNARRFRSVWEILKALRAHDSEFAELLDSYRLAISRGNSHLSDKLNKKLVFDLPSKIDQKFSDALRTIIIENATDNWKFMFELTKSYKKINQDLLIPADYVTENEYKLGAWLNTQKTNYKKGLLSASRITQLESVGIVWYVHDHKFYLGLKYFKAFKKSHDHCEVPNRFIAEDDYRLGGWVGSIRTAWDRNKLREEHEKLLIENDFIFDILEYWFEKYFESLKQFKYDNGHLDVKQNYIDKKGVKLGYFVSKTRAKFKKGDLNKEKETKLNNLGFIWIKK